VRFALAAVVLVGLLFAFVYPTRTFLDQRDDTNRARAQLALLRTENAKLEKIAERLQDPAEIEKLARRWGLVKPNEAAFVVVPAPEAVPVPAPDAASGGADSTAP
jgi:cell division protein FtsB